MYLLGIVLFVFRECILEGLEKGSFLVLDECVVVFDLGYEFVEDGEVVEIVGG